jgi:hypothetical protein
LVQSVERRAKSLLASQNAEPAVAMKRRDMVLDLQKAAPFWQQGMISMLRTRDQQRHGVGLPPRRSASPRQSRQQR